MSTVTTKRPRITQADKARKSVGLTVVMMTEQELSLRWQISVKTLQRWRLMQTGPKFTKLQNRAVRYHLDDIKAYESQRA